jgi:Tol biopolymer transport system component
MINKILGLSGWLVLILLTVSCCGIFSGKALKEEKPQVKVPPAIASYTAQAVQQWYKQNKPYLTKALAANRIIYFQAGANAGVYSKTFGKNDKVRIPSFNGNMAMPVLSKNHKILYLQSFDNIEQKFMLMSVSREQGAKYLYAFTKPPYYYDVSPDGQELAFSTKEGDIYQIYRVNLNTKEETLFTDSLIGGLFPNYSPSGNSIAYCAKHKLRVKDIDTGKERILVDDPMLKEMPEWSLDGTWIVYAAKIADEALYDIYKVNVYTSKVIQLTIQPGLDANPSFDCTGQYIIFMSAIDSTQGNQKLAIMDANGDDIRIDPTSDINIYYPQMK